MSRYNVSVCESFLSTEPPRPPLAQNGPWTHFLCSLPPRVVSRSQPNMLIVPPQEIPSSSTPVLARLQSSGCAL